MRLGSIDIRQGEGGEAVVGRRNVIAGIHFV